MLRNMSVKKKMILLIVMPLLLLVLSSGISMIGLRTIASEFDTFVNGISKVETLVQETRIDVSKIQIQVDGLMLFGVEDSSMSKIYDEVDKSVNDTLTHLNEIGRLLPSNKMLVDNYDQAINNWLNNMDLAIQAHENKDATVMMTYLHEASLDSEKMNAVAVQLQSEVDFLVQKEVQKIRQIEFLVMMATLVFFIAVMVVTVLIGRRVYLSVVVPTRLIVEVLKKINEGDLSANVAYESKDDLGNLARSLNQTVSRWNGYISELSNNFHLLAIGDLNVSLKMEYLGDFALLKTDLESISVTMNETLTQISEASMQVTAGSQQVASASQSLAQGAAEQSSSIELLSASIHDISNQVTLSATHAKDANHRANEIGTYLDKSNRQMNEMIRAMETIGSKSTEISKIIKTIDNIAFQTNILALNAAVEAARAGNAGKGFAVVADEVRNLASKSAQAAKDTDVLIKDTIAAVENGTKIADETAQSLVDVVRGASSIIGLVANIASAANEEATAIGQINAGVDQISSVVQTNSATSEESAAAAEELLGQSEMLRGLIDGFKLIDQSGVPSVSYDRQETNHEEVKEVHEIRKIASYPTVSKRESRGQDKYE